MDTNDANTFMNGQHSSNQQQQQQKKKYRGNRKLQRFRAKLRKRGFNDETITTLIHGYNDYSNQYDNEEESIISNIDVEVFIPLKEQV